MSDYVKARLNEASTYRNAVLLVGALLGMTLQEHEIDVIVHLAIGIAGFMGLVSPDKITSH